MSNINMAIPEEYLCPISLEIMTDPMVAADGHSYQKESIIGWLSKGNKRSPITGANLSFPILYDNFILKKIINESLCLEHEQILQAEVKSDLEKAIQEKDEIIKTLLEKIDIINISQNENNSLNNKLLVLNQEILDLQRNLNQQQEDSSNIKIEMLKLEQINLELRNENSNLKKQLKRGNIQLNERRSQNSKTLSEMMMKMEKFK